MRFNFLKRALALLLLVCTLLLAACGKAQAPTKAQRLTVEGGTRAPITSEQREEMTSITVELFCSALYSADGMVLSSEHKAKLAELVRGKIIPIFEETLSYEDFKELSVLNFDIADIHSLFDTYLSVTSVLDAQKAGRLFYGLALIYFEQSRRASAEEYAKYGNSWNLEDTQKYARQYKELSDKVNPNDFALVMSMTSLFASSADIFGELDEISVFSEDKDSYLLTVMRRQAALLRKASSRDSLAYAGKLVLEFVFGELNAPKHFDTLESNEWYALGASGDALYELCLTLPELFELYSAFANTLTRAEANSLLSEDSGEREKTALAVLGRCSDELTAWANELSSRTLAGEREMAAIKNCGEAEGFAEYEERRSEITPSELASAVREGGESLDTAIENFMFSVAPYATYVYYGRG